MSGVDDGADELIAEAGGGGRRDYGGGSVISPSEDEPTGYKRPPKEHQFKPGQSGNPRGRPKGAPGLRTILETELKQKVRFTHNDKIVSFSKLQVIVKRMVDKAFNGDQRAIEQLISLNITMFGLGNEDQTKDAPLTDGELAFLETITKRLPSGDEAAGLTGDFDALRNDESTSDAG